MGSFLVVGFLLMIMRVGLLVTSQLLIGGQLTHTPNPSVDFNTGYKELVNSSVGI